MLQPFKYITVTMEEATAGIPDVVTRETHDYRYNPVILLDNGNGHVPQTKFAVDPGKACIGVLMETFPQAGAQSKVMVQGTCEMYAYNVKAGDAVYTNGSEIVDYTQKGTDHLVYIGLALTGTKPDTHGWINVLIK